jgi:hypothetical protein
VNTSYNYLTDLTNNQSNFFYERGESRLVSQLKPAKEAARNVKVLTTDGRKTARQTHPRENGYKEAAFIPEKNPFTVFFLKHLMHKVSDAVFP